MRSNQRLLLVAPLALVAASGCTLIADPGSYRYDKGCDLDLRLDGFEVHETFNLTVQVDTPQDGPDPNRLLGLAMLVGIPAEHFTFHVPHGVASERANLDFFADIAEPFGRYNPRSVGGGRGDHSWTIRNACAKAENQFTHVAIFQDFPDDPPTLGLEDDLTFDLQGFDVEGHDVEIRALLYDPSLDAIDGDGDGRYTRAFQHTHPAHELTPGHFVPEPLRASVDRGVAFEVIEIWVDRDGDQVVDDASTAGDPLDEGFVFTQVDPPALGPIVLVRADVGTDDHSGTVGLFIHR